MYFQKPINFIYYKIFSVNAATKHSNNIFIHYFQQLLQTYPTQTSSSSGLTRRRAEWWRHNTWRSTAWGHRKLQSTRNTSGAFGRVRAAMRRCWWRCRARYVIRSRANRKSQSERRKLKTRRRLAVVFFAKVAKNTWPWRPCSFCCIKKVAKV